MNAQKPRDRRPIKGGRLTHWISLFLDYFDAKARLMAAESREAGSHFIGLLFLIAITLLLSLTSVLMYGTSLLYLVASLFGLSLGWSALICRAILTLASLLFFFFLRVQLRKPLFQMSLKDLEKDKEWLSQSKIKTP
jgi:uncharacterized membrane protein YqjE